LIKTLNVATVCEEARCPNAPSCFAKPTAAFMILGDRCTRNCTFCSVRKGRPAAVDPDEPERVALAAEELGLRYVVVTSVTRDDLDDGGASHFARTIHAIRTRLPAAKVEVLTPDFVGKESSIDKVIAASPDVFNHNLETVPRLYASVRAGADFERSLKLLKRVRESGAAIRTKSGLMLGLGETLPEVRHVLKRLREAGCEMLTMGQYLRPTRKSRLVSDYISPDVFELLRLEALQMRFTFAASAPLVRSSMNAEEMFLSTQMT
jgi:lipoyl synthase